MFLPDVSGGQCACARPTMQPPWGRAKSGSNRKYYINVVPKNIHRNCLGLNFFLRSLQVLGHHSKHALGAFFVKYTKVGWKLWKNSRIYRPCALVVTSVPCSDDKNFFEKKKVFLFRIFSLYIDLMQSKNTCLGAFSRPCEKVVFDFFMPKYLTIPKPFFSSSMKGKIYFKKNELILIVFKSKRQGI